MDQSLYDEFGNYIGPEIEDDFDEDEESDYEVDVKITDDGDIKELATFTDHDGKSEAITAESLKAAASQDIISHQAVIPHEEKTYYPDASEVYPGVETLVEDEDTQLLSEPIITPFKAKAFDLIEKEIPVTTFDYEFMMHLMNKPELIRQICFLGHLHCGKTSLLDIFIMQTHNDNKGRKWVLDKHPRYADTRQDERDCGLSIKAVPISLVLPDSKEKSYLFHIFDTPGHVNFQDEATAAMRLCDGALIVVDAVFGVMLNTESLLKHALKEHLSLCLVINCIDRLILELRLPPVDAYFKIRHTIEEVNTIVAEYCELLNLTPVRFSPVLGNVLFASSYYGFVFTLFSFCEKYSAIYQNSISKRRGGWMRGLDSMLDWDMFIKCMWGDMYYDRETGTFSKKPKNPDQERTFVEFILNPLYKIFAHTLSEEHDLLLAELDIKLPKHIFDTDSRSVLRSVCQEFFGNTSALVDMVVRWVPNPKQHALTKVRHCYLGRQTDDVSKDMIELNTQGTLMIHTTKTYHRPNCVDADVFGRVFSGTVYAGQKVKILGETYSSEDREDIEYKEITNLWIYQTGRYRVEVPFVPAGNWVLIGGISKYITKTAMITNAEMVGQPGTLSTAQPEIFRSLRFQTKSVIRVSCEPLNPSELPKMLEGFRKIIRSYPICETKVEESGEHVILGTGELSLNCILHDLRKLYGDLEIKVADPVSQFCETVVEVSALKCFANTPNQKSRLHMVVEPLEANLAEEIENGIIKWPGTIHVEEENVWDTDRLKDVLMSRYNWDLLAAKNVWAFGPTEEGPNILVNDTIPSEVDSNELNHIKNFVVQGFQWVTREGPLIEEPVRSCKFRLMDAQVAPEPMHRSGGQIIPTTRRVAYSAFLLATPRLMEPIFFVEIESPADCVAAVYTVLAKRRGHVIKDMPKPGTPVYIVHAHLPTIESFGFETDLRTHTSGQAFCLSIFDHWALVPGDPLNKSIIIRPLEPAPIPHLAREFLIKTRRRKGLSENVSIQKFFDDPKLAELAKEVADLDQYF